MHAAGQPVQVLVVEDCPDNAESLRVLLRLWGFDAAVVGNGAVAIAETGPLRPTVALIDLGLPGADGFEVARRFRDGSGDCVPLLVAITGHVSRRDRERAFEAGFDEFLPKPLDLDRLRAILSSVKARPRM